MRSNKRNTRKRSFKKKQKSIKRGGSINIPIPPDEFEKRMDELDPKDWKTTFTTNQWRKNKIISRFIRRFYEDIDNINERLKLIERK